MDLIWNRVLALCVILSILDAVLGTAWELRESRFASSVRSAVGSVGVLLQQFEILG